MSKSDNYDVFVNALLKNVWGKRLRGLSVAQLELNGPIRHEDVEYLLNRYPFLQIISTDPKFPEEGIQTKLIDAKSGWTIHDYGDAMSASPGELLFRRYEEEEEGGETGGTGTIIKQAYITAQEMVKIAASKGWPGIDIVDGTPIMKWATWMAALDRELLLNGYEPTEDDHKKRARLRKLYEEEELEMRPKKGPELR